MKYFEVITSDTTWTCPKTGMWKIIAVGGGSSGVVRGYSGSSNRDVTKDVTLYSNGGDTLFGTDLTANGGIVVNGYKGHIDNTVYTGFCYMTGGAGGYNLNTYGGTGAYSFSRRNDSSDVRIYISSPSTGNGGSIGCQGLGYGAGGALNFAINHNDNDSYYCLESGISSAGVLNETVIDISANTSYTCTIGKGGSITQEELNTFKTNIGYDSTYFLPSDVGYGRDGCIVVQYVGESY